MANTPIDPNLKSRYTYRKPHSLKKNGDQLWTNIRPEYTRHPRNQTFPATPMPSFYQTTTSPTSRNNKPTRIRLMKMKKSELYLSVTSVEDNGTFSCIAENRAGSARANFTLHVVIPMPPKPPQVRRNSQFFSNFVVMKSSKSIYFLNSESFNAHVEKWLQKLHFLDYSKS